ncbi:MAG: hypothetical protein M1831_007169 [Alyxoria varia]|nr:MAG: hypothetical protein M1831_007169 [Alyxoria varia]
MGGLVVEDLLLASKNSAEGHLKRVLEWTTGIAFLGTPFCGSHLAAWGSILGGFANLLKKSNVPLVEVLRPESEVLARIQHEFHSMIRDRDKTGYTPIEITCFFEDLAFPGVGFIVPKHSAILQGRTPCGIHANHVDMTKFSENEDAGYQAILGELWRWSPNADQAAQHSAASFQTPGDDASHSITDSKNDAPFECQAQADDGHACNLGVQQSEKHNASEAAHLSKRSAHRPAIPAQPRRQTERMGRPRPNADRRGFWLDRSPEEDIVPEPEPPRRPTRSRDRMEDMMVGFWDAVRDVLADPIAQRVLEWSKPKIGLGASPFGGDEELVIWYGFYNREKRPWRGDSGGPGLVAVGRERPGDMVESIPEEWRNDFIEEGNDLLTWMAWRLTPPDPNAQRRYTGRFAFSEGNYFFWYWILRQGDMRISNALKGGAPYDDDAFPDPDHPENWSMRTYRPNGSFEEHY